jgi:hypothetical protein
MRNQYFKVTASVFSALMLEVKGLNAKHLDQKAWKVSTHSIAHYCFAISRQLQAPRGQTRGEYIN